VDIWQLFRSNLNGLWVFCFYHGTSVGAPSPKAGLMIARTKHFSSSLSLAIGHYEFAGFLLNKVRVFSSKKLGFKVIYSWSFHL
jgi:hypothetical protein